MRTMQFIQEGLGNSSYVLDVGNGNAVIIDPDRSIDRYLDALRTNGLQLSGIFETHLHADFVSGAREMAVETGAPIFLAAAAGSRLPVRPLVAGQLVQVNGVEVTAVATPGHTPEHLSFALSSAAGPPLLFSGGSLIVGGAARTDLIWPAMTDELTRAQFRTLHNAFTDLPDETLLYPTHGGGSFCSTGAAQERTSTLGRERRDNPLMAITSEEEFASWFPTTFPAAPAYFFRMRAVNLAGPRLRAEIPLPRPLQPEDFDRLRAGSIVVDVRSKEEYASGYIPGSLSNPFRDDYAVWLGWLVSEGSKLLFVLGETPLAEVIDQSLLVGYEHFAGWLQGSVAAWRSAGRELRSIELADARRARQLLLDGAALIDVREPDEYRAGHVEGATLLPLGSLAANTALVPRDRPVVVYCGHGERASTGASLLESAGFSGLVNLDGGTDAWQDAGFTLSREV